MLEVQVDDAVVDCAARGHDAVVDVAILTLMSLYLQFAV